MHALIFSVVVVAVLFLVFIGPDGGPPDTRKSAPVQTTDGIYESAVKKINEGRTYELTDEEAKRFNEVTYGAR